MLCDKCCHKFHMKISGTHIGCGVPLEELYPDKYYCKDIGEWIVHSTVRPVIECSGFEMSEEKKPEETDPYALGVRAAYAEHKHSNPVSPYKPGSPDYKKWDQGYLDAEHDIESADESQWEEK